MRSFTPFLVLPLVFALGGCAQRPAPAVADPQRDGAQIQVVLTAWYDAMHVRDSAGTARPLTPEFYLLEDTLPLDRDQLVARILGGRGSGTSFTSSRSDFHTRVRGDVAWTTFRNHETSRDATGKECAGDFLETVVFVREAGGWLIDRYHAAALHPWTC